MGAGKPRTMTGIFGKISNWLLSVLAGAAAFGLTLLGFLMLGRLDEQVVASLFIGLFALMVVRVAAERPNSGHARAVAALADRLLALGRGDLSSPAPLALRAEMPGLAAAVDNLVEQVRSSLDNFRAMAMYDPVTALPNRVHFKREAERILKARHGTGGTALLFIDLDGFKEVNDRLGHAQGDQMLAMVANRLRIVVKGETLSGTPTPPLLARLAGDEFTILLPDVEGRDEAERIARRALEALSEPFRNHGQSSRMGASIGVALSPDHGAELTELMKAADVAMYHAKASGRSRVCVYDPSLARASVARARLEAELRGAVETGALELVYRPQLCLRSGAITGAEALVRWNRGGGESRILEPAIAAEDETAAGWTLETAGRALASWRSAGLPQRLCVPVGPRLLECTDFVERLRTLLAASGPPPWSFELELSERAVAASDPRLLAELQALRDEGLTIAVADFGSGQSSLAGLADLPVDRIKLDAGLIVDVDGSERARTIVAALVHLIHGLGCEAVAVDVQRQGQLEVLRTIGCDTLQGFFCAEPMTEDAFIAWASAQDCARSLARAS
jgi:diguanylate cyclase (GGDEF)-like protein